jgi:uncharacterized tellurite resistance protein B-like protein
MDADEIITNLKTTTYKFAYATKIRKEVQKLDRTDLYLLRADLKRHLKRQENSDLTKSLNHIVNALTQLSFSLDFESGNLSLKDDSYYREGV